MINQANAKKILSNGQLQALLKSATNKDILLSKAFELVGRSRTQIGYEVIAMRADVPSTPNKGEVELTMQLGVIGEPKANKMYELTYSRKMKKISFDEETPNLF
jgi:hypothetical protein